MLFSSLTSDNICIYKILDSVFCGCNCCSWDRTKGWFIWIKKVLVWNACSSSPLWIDSSANVCPLHRSMKTSSGFHEESFLCMLDDLHRVCEKLLSNKLLCLMWTAWIANPSRRTCLSEQCLYCRLSRLQSDLSWYQLHRSIICSCLPATTYDRSPSTLF